MRINRGFCWLGKRMSLVTALGWVASAHAQTQDRDDMWRMMGSAVRSGEQQDITWFLVMAALLILVVILFAMYSRRANARVPRIGTAPRVAHRSFAEQAGAMGFKSIEVANLRRIASHLSGGGDPVSVLTTGSGRQFLDADLRKRIRRREREITLLTGMLKKLGARADRAFHDRGSVRVETDTAIWLIKKSEATEVTPADQVIVDIAPVSGHLVDLSEGGAAIHATTELEAGDVVEFWSADTQLWIPPTLSGVVNTRHAADGDIDVNLHFLDPPLTQIRQAIQQIQRSERGNLDDTYNGPDSEDSN